MISPATLSSLGTTPTRDSAIRLVDALSRLSPSSAAQAAQASPVSRLAPQSAPTPIQAPGRGSGRGSLLDLSV